MNRPFLALADPDILPASLRHPVLAIGNFDGVHRGHQALLRLARQAADARSVPAAVLTFSPHPRAFFKPGEPQFRLTPADIQAERIAGAGLDGLIVLTFDAELAGLAAEDFVSRILIGRFGISGVVVGTDFHFGRARSGTPTFLREAGERHGFSVAMVGEVAETGGRVSSSRIRAALGAGDPALANRLLGYEWFVRAKVAHGAKRGRALNYPTANMALDPSCGLREGVYAVRARIDGVWRGGVASFGRRPMFDNGAPLLETHVFDYSGDLYDRVLDVAFVAFLRPEQTFSGVESLVRQMDADSAAARIALAGPKI